MKICTRLICLPILGILCNPSLAATLVISSGQLTGANGVDVDGILYNVTFEDDTCMNVFDGCDDAATDFTFTTFAAADLASEALGAQVFQDGSDPGPSDDFSSDPALTFGCSANTICTIWTPYSLQTETAVSTRGWSNRAAGASPDGLASATHLTTEDFSLNGERVYANWEVVPVPAAAWLFGSALAMLGWLRRKTA